LIAVDTNVLVYAHREELPQHSAARTRLTELAEGDALWAIPVFCLGEFIRVVTHRRLFDPPHTIDEACGALDRLLESPSLRILNPGERFWPLLAEAVRDADATGNLVFDAQLAALCRENGVSTLLTEDRDFDRFPKLSIERLRG
jgi:toxin-antitoxin system PIN domain toxin